MKKLQIEITVEVPLTECGRLTKFFELVEAFNHESHEIESSGFAEVTDSATIKEDEA